MRAELQVILEGFFQESGLLPYQNQLINDVLRTTSLPVLSAKCLTDKLFKLLLLDIFYCIIYI